MKRRYSIIITLLAGIILISGQLQAHTPETATSPAVAGVPAPAARLTGLRQPAVISAFSYRKSCLKKLQASFQPSPAPKLAFRAAPPSTLALAFQDEDRSGRTELITSSMAYTLLYYGWAVPTAMEAQGGRPYVASYMLLGGASFFVPFLATRESNVTKGMARGFTVGGGLGIPHGWALTLALMGDDIDGHVGLGTSVVTSISEGLLLLNYARINNLSLGHLSMMGYGGSWGGLLLVGTPYFFDSESVRSYAITGLVGSGLGMWGGNHLASTIPVADGDPQIMGTTGALGAYLSFALIQTASNDFPKGALATLMTGSAIGLGLGIMKIKGLDYSSADANLISLGTLAGGLIGLGAIYISAEDPSAEAYLWGSGLGAVGGFILTDKLIIGPSSPKLGSLKLQFNPLALRNIVKPASVSNNPANPLNQAHLVNASFRF